LGILLLIISEVEPQSRICEAEVEYVGVEDAFDFHPLPDGCPAFAYIPPLPYFLEYIELNVGFNPGSFFSSDITLNIYQGWEGPLIGAHSIDGGNEVGKVWYRFYFNLQLEANQTYYFQPSASVSYTIWTSSMNGSEFNGTIPCMARTCGNWSLACDLKVFAYNVNIEILDCCTPGCYNGGLCTLGGSCNCYDGYLGPDCISKTTGTTGTTAISTGTTGSTGTTAESTGTTGSTGTTAESTGTTGSTGTTNDPTTQNPTTATTHDPTTGTTIDPTTADPSTGSTQNPSTGSTQNPTTATTHDPTTATTHDLSTGTTQNPTSGTTGDPTTATTGDLTIGTLHTTGSATGDDVSCGNLVMQLNWQAGLFFVLSMICMLGI